MVIIEGNRPADPLREHRICSHFVDNLMLCITFRWSSSRAVSANFISQFSQWVLDLRDVSVMSIKKAPLGSRLTTNHCVIYLKVSMIISTRVGYVGVDIVLQVCQSLN